MSDEELDAVHAVLNAVRTEDGFESLSEHDQSTDLVGVTEDQLDLGPLTDNGGPTMTHVLGEGSVAIDRIPAEDCELETDQRGFPRPAGDGCDIGAYEQQP